MRVKARGVPHQELEYVSPYRGQNQVHTMSNPASPNQPADEAGPPQQPPTNIEKAEEIPPSSSRFELTPQDWEVLLMNIEEGKCTPFLGAGACVPTLPLGSELAEEWAVKFEYPLKDRDLSKVAQFVAVTHREGLFPKNVLTKWLRNCAYPDFTSECQVHRLLAEFPLPVYVTTNYDDFMLRALQAADKRDAKHDFCRWNDDLRFRADELNLPPSIFGENSQYEPTPEEPVVFHLHGHKDHPDSLVLTEDDYIDFLIAVSQNEQLLPPRIIRAFSRSTLLFVGYSLADWNFRLLFRKLVTYIQQGQGSGRRRAHLSVQVEPFAGKDDVSIEQREKALDYLNQYYSELNIRVYWGSCEDFTRALRTRWRMRYNLTASANPNYVASGAN